MTYRPTEMQILKRMLFERKDYDPDFNGTQANMLIGDSIDAAYNDLPIDDVVHIDDACRRLDNYARERGKSISKHAALELLAAVGDALSGMEE